jgi:hypothetical protein
VRRTVDLHPAARAFEQALKEQGIETHHRYATQASAFMRWMESRTQKPFSSAAVTRNDVLAYADAVVLSRPLSRSVEATNMLRRFFRYEQERGAIAKSPVEGLRASLLPPAPTPAPRVLRRIEPAPWPPPREASRSAANDSGPPEAPSTPAPALSPAEGDRAGHPLLEQAIAAGWRRQGGRPSGHVITRRSRMPDDKEAAEAPARLHDDERRRS